MKNLPSNLFYIFLIAALLALNVYSLLMRRKQATEIMELTTLTSDRENKLSAIYQQYDLLKQSYISSLHSPFYFSENSVIYNKDHKNKIILRIHENDCNTCVEATIHILEEYRAKKNFDVIIVSDYNNMASMTRDFKLLPYPIIFQKKFELDTPGNTSPFLFVLDKDNKANGIFFPNWMATDLLRQYVGELRKRNFI